MLATAKQNNWIVDPEGKNSSCQSCQIAKAKQEDINKESDNKLATPGERMMIDISTVRGQKQSKWKLKGNCFWLLIIDEATSMKWSYFLPKKDDQVKTMINFIKAMRVRKPGSVKYIQCNNAGENKALEKII